MEDIEYYNQILINMKKQYWKDVETFVNVTL
jgi:hypothetical protein